MPDEALNELQQKLEEMFPDGQVSNELNFIKNHHFHSVDEMINALQDQSAEKETRLILCWILGRSDDPKSREALSGSAKDNDAEIRTESVKSLGSLGEIKAVPLIVDLMMRDTNTEVRKSAAYALGLIGDPSAFDMLMFKLFDKQEHPDVRGMAAEALGDLGNEFAVAPLIRALQENPDEVKFWIVNSLGRLGKNKALAPLKKLIDDLKSNNNDSALQKEAEEAVETIEAMKQDN